MNQKLFWQKKPLLIAWTFAIGAWILACSDDLPGQANLVSQQQRLGSEVISNAQFIINCYQTILAREPDGPGFDSHVAAVAGGLTRQQDFLSFLGSTEFTNNASLADKGNYVRRLFSVILERNASDADVNHWVGMLKNADGTGAEALTWFDAFEQFFDSTEYASLLRPVAGVHFPIPIDPSVQITNADFLTQSYKILLNRDYDMEGFLHNLELLQQGQTRLQMFNALKSSTEFTGNPALWDKQGFIGRIYQTLLLRNATQNELDQQSVRIREYNDTGAQPLTWFDFYLETVAGAEFKQRNCQTSYYVYGQPLPKNAPLLRDVVNKKARLQTVSESEVLQLNFAAGGEVTAVWDQKLPVLLDASTGDHYAFTRGYNGPSNTFNIYLLRADPTNDTQWTQVGGPVFEKSGTTTFYDPHISIDNSVCPKRYVMTMECWWPGLGHASLCLSHTSTPFKQETWSTPVLAVSGCNTSNPGCGGHYRSASTGLTVMDHKTPYVSWTEVDDGTSYCDAGSGQTCSDEGIERTSSSVIPINSLYTPNAVSVADFSNVYNLEAEPNICCTSSWDCNNKDGQDWKVEGPYFYMIYNGANYFRCVRPSQGIGAGLTSQWALSLARSRNPSGLYPESLAQDQIVWAQRNDTCGTSYPVVNVLRQRLYLFFAHYEPAGGNTTRRGEILWTAQPALDEDHDGYATPADCDDTNPAIHPGAAEVCNLVDDDCDGETDEGTCVFAHAGGSTCTASGCVMTCDDGYADCQNGPTDGCETNIVGDSQNCGQCGRACSANQTCVERQCNSTCPDQDSDGFADWQCGGLDCNDSDPSIHPGATEICGDGVDQDCDAMDPPCEEPESDAGEDGAATTDSGTEDDGIVDSGAGEDASPPDASSDIGNDTPAADPGSGDPVAGGCGCSADGGSMDSTTLMAFLMIVLLRKEKNRSSPPTSIPRESIA